MLELIFSAIGLGIMISLVLIGPVFFLLIETSISKGARAALALDAGVIVGDILCIIVAYSSSYDLLKIIDNHPGLYRITAFIIFIYALVMILTKTKTKTTDDPDEIVTKNYLRTFFNGLFLNILNIGVVVFWIITIISIRTSYPNPKESILYIGIVVATFFSIDLMKILLAKYFKSKIKENTVTKIRKIVGVILLAFSIILFYKSNGHFKSLDQRLPQENIN